MAPILESTLKGANIAGDGHYTWASKWLDEVHFHSPHRVSRTLSVEDFDEGDFASRLTKQKEKDNSELARARATVESPYGLAKVHFPALGEPWLESLLQQRYMVFIYFGIRNYQIDLEEEISDEALAAEVEQESSAEISEVDDLDDKAEGDELSYSSDHDMDEDL